MIGAERKDRKESIKPAAPFDAQIPIASLPGYYRANVNAFPHRDHYLVPDRHVISGFREELANLGSGTKIGICWRAGRIQSRQYARSMPLPMLAEIFTNETLVSLQHGSADEEIDALHLSSSVNIQRLTDIHNNLDAMAGLLCALDYVVSVDSTTVHLCGALGVKCFALIPYVPEWRYLSAGESMPWYQSVTLLRQQSPGDWQAPLERLAELTS